MNGFESGSRKLIPATLIYARLGDRVLMIHRISEGRVGREGDYHEGKWNGLGGKLEPDESALECARRELKEESGLDLPEDRFRALGTLHFPNFKAHKNEDWLAFVYVARVEESDLSNLIAESPEGKLHWIPARDLLSLNLWPGDRLFIPLVAENKPFHGTIWYRGQEVARHSITVF